MRSLQVIWAALVGTVLLYTLVAFWAMTSGIVDFSVFDPGIMPYVAGAALLLMLGGTVVRRVMVRRIDPEGDPNARLAAYMNASVLGLAVTEAIAADRGRSADVRTGSGSGRPRGRTTTPQIAAISDAVRMPILASAPR